MFVQTHARAAHDSFVRRDYIKCAHHIATALQTNPTDAQHRHMKTAQVALATIVASPPSRDLTGDRMDRVITAMGAMETALNAVIGDADVADELDVSATSDSAPAPAAAIRTSDHAAFAKAHAQTAQQWFGRHKYLECRHSIDCALELADADARPHLKAARTALDTVTTSPPIHQLTGDRLDAVMDATVAVQTALATVVGVTPETPAPDTPTLDAALAEATERAATADPFGSVRQPGAADGNTTSVRSHVRSAARWWQQGRPRECAAHLDAALKSGPTDAQRPYVETALRAATLLTAYMPISRLTGDRADAAIKAVRDLTAACKAVTDGAEDDDVTTTPPTQPIRPHVVSAFVAFRDQRFVACGQHVADALAVAVGASDTRHLKAAGRALQTIASMSPRRLVDGDASLEAFGQVESALVAVLGRETAETLRA